MQISHSDHPGDLLIVDDLADNLRVLSNTLAEQGYRVRAARNGTMALVGACAYPPDLILLDIRMPEMDGYEVCRRLKADPRTQPIPIIFLSALDEVVDKARAFEVGGADYITKPFQVEEVLARVGHQLTIQQLKKQVARQQQQLAQIETRAAVSECSSLVGNSTVRTAIHTILDYSDRLSRHPAIDLEQYAALRVIYQNGQTLLELVNSQ